VRRDAAFSSPAEQTEASELSSAARWALIELPVEEREAVSLCCEQDMMRKSAAELLEIPEATLTSRVQRSLEKLRLRLSAQGFATLTPVLIGEGLRNVQRQTPRRHRCGLEPQFKCDRKQLDDDRCERQPGWQRLQRTGDGQVCVAVKERGEVYEVSGGRVCGPRRQLSCTPGALSRIRGNLF
jgi:predicted DNA-binding protein (UPF0251 family)